MQPQGTCAFVGDTDSCPRNKSIQYNNKMEEVSDITEFSTSSRGSSPTEHIAYFTEELGLDAGTAALLYRAERLQEKGQLRLALK